MNEPLLTRTFLWLVAAHFLQGLGYASMLLLPLYLAFLGASRTEIATIMAMAAIGSVVCRPIAAWSLDAAGRKKTLVIGTFVMVLPMLGFAFVTEVSWLAYLLRLIMGAGVGALWTGYFTFATDLIPIARRTEGIALFGVSGLIPLVVNPFAKEIGLSAAELRWFFPVIGALTALSLLPLAAIAEPKRARTVERFSFGAAARALRVRSLFSIWLAICTLGGAVSVFQAFVTVTAESRGVARPALVWLTYAFGAAFVRIAGGRLPDRVGPAKLVPPAFIAYASAAAIAAFGDTSAAFGLAGLCAGIGHGIGFPVFTSQLISRTPDHLRGSAVGSLTALWELSALALTPVFGAIADAKDDRTMFIAAAVAILIGLFLWWPLEKTWN